jgi:hypothetical protein
MKTTTKSSRSRRQTASRHEHEADDLVIGAGGEQPIQSMTESQLQERLKYFARRARALCGMTWSADGTTRVPIGKAVGDALDAMALGLTDPKSIAARNEFLAKVEKDPAAKSQFCALRLETYNNYLMAQMQWISFYFEVIQLKDDERPLVQNTYDKELKCHYVGQDGRNKMFKLFKDHTEQVLPLRTLTSPRTRYKVMDIYRGNIIDQAVKSLTITRDLANKMEYECFQLLQNSAFGPFTFTGPKPSWPYVSNSYIDTDNLPTTNDVAVLNATGKFDYPVLDEIIDYAARFDGVSGDGMQFRPTGRLLVPSKHVRQFGMTAPLQATAPMASKIEENLLENGWTGVKYKGIDWRFIPSPHLSPNDNVCYPEFSVKAGRVFLKPGMDREVIRTGQDDYNLFQDNEEERWLKKVFAAYINSATKIHIARFDYSEV